MIAAAISPTEKTAAHNIRAPKSAYTVVPAHGATAKLRLNAMENAPMYAPRLCGGATSATYADACGNSIISPKVQTTIPSMIISGPLANPNNPDPAANRSEPRLNAHRCGQWAVAALSGTS